MTRAASHGHMMPDKSLLWNDAALGLRCSAPRLIPIGVVRASM